LRGDQIYGGLAEMTSRTAASASVLTQRDAPSAAHQPRSVVRPPVGGHIPGLDGIRGVAVIAVVIYHLGGIGPVHARGGWIGVDVFFVLSGFLITSLLLTEHARSGTIALGQFWARRARRLLPALVVLLLTVCVVSMLRDNRADRATLGADTLWSLGYGLNWVQALAGNGHAVAHELRHLWSLAVEEQAYVLWPGTLLLVLRRGSATAVLITATALAAVSATVMGILAAQGTPLDRLYFGSDTHLQPLAVGAALAAALHVRPPRVAARRRLLGPSGLIAAAFLGAEIVRTSSTDPDVYRGGFLLVALAAACLVLAVVAGPPTVLTRALSGRAIGWIGQRSYGLYLWHWPVICWLTADAVGFDGVRLQVVRIAVMMTCTVASYRWIEVPIRTRRTGPSTALWVAGFAVVVGLATLMAVS
jgi:peptidoglycan/LPS O-acetylase OafA/YrhL